GWAEAGECRVAAPLKAEASGINRTANKQNTPNSWTVSRRIGFLIKRRRIVAVSSPLAESIANVASRNHCGTSGEAATKRRMGSNARIKIHHLAGRLSRSAQSKTESGNQKGEAHSWLKDMP